jgi:hypothetical protein
MAKTAPFNHGSGKMWLREIPAAAVAAGTYAATGTFEEFMAWIKDSKRVPTGTKSEVEAEGEEKFTLASTEQVSFEGTFLLNDLALDDFLSDLTKYYQIIKEDTAKLKANGKHEYTLYGIAKVAERSERAGKGTERAFKFEIHSAPDDIVFSGTLTGSATSATVAITQEKGKYYKSVEV